MPVYYKVSPEFNVAIYICKGLVTADEIFRMSDAVFPDDRLKPGFILILDLLSAVEIFDLQHINQIIERIDQGKERDIFLGRILVLSQSRGIHLLVDTLKLLPSKFSLPIDAFSTIDDAVHSLGLRDMEQKFMQFWRESNSIE